MLDSPGVEAAAADGKIVESAVPPRPSTVQFFPEIAVSAVWWFAAWVGCYVYVESAADRVPDCDASECFSARDWLLAGLILFGIPLALAGVLLSAVVVAVVRVTGIRMRWPPGLLGTAVTWTTWLVLAGVVALWTAYPTLR